MITTTIKTLHVMAIHEGTKLKRFIENILDKATADFDESLLYEHLSKSDPEGKQALGLQEKQILKTGLAYESDLF